MALPYDETWANFESILSSNSSVQHSWQRLIDFLKKLIDKPYWDDLSNLDVFVEQAEIKDWLTMVISESPLPDTITALWFGITQLWDEDSQTAMNTIYLNGADVYDPDDIDWAADCNYDPENKYISPEVLQGVDEIIKNDKEHGSFLSWILPLAYSAFILDRILRADIDKEMFLKYKSKLFVTVGHDSGDYINLSPIER